MSCSVSTIFGSFITENIYYSLWFIRNLWKRLYNFTLILIRFIPYSHIFSYQYFLYDFVVSHLFSHNSLCFPFLFCFVQFPYILHNYYFSCGTCRVFLHLFSYTVTTFVITPLRYSSALFHAVLAFSSQWYDCFRLYFPLSRSHGYNYVIHVTQVISSLCVLASLTRV